jgi:hypothetical protein
VDSVLGNFGAYISIQRLIEQNVGSYKPIMRGASFHRRGGTCGGAMSQAKSAKKWHEGRAPYPPS